MRPALLSVLLLGALSAYPQPAPMPYQKAGMEAYRGKDYERCAAIFVDALRKEPKQSVTPAAGAARCYAASGNVAEARRYLDIALSRGYRGCKFLSEDPVFAPLRTHAEWNAALERCRTNEERFYNGLNAEIFVAFLADQRDRASNDADAATVLRHDADHRRLVHLAIDHHWLKTADDYYHAGMIMQHGTTPDDFALARALAEHAIVLDHSHANALWLYAAATDRYLQSTGAPQVYGTQYKQVGGLWTLEPFNPKGVTDEERLRHGVGSASERLKFIEQLNAKRQPLP